MRTTWRTELPLLVVVAAMFVVAAVVWSSMPERIPTHWNAAGEVDGYGGKLKGLLTLPLVALGVYVLTLVFPRVDPLGGNYARFEGVYQIIRYAIVLVLAAVYGFTVLRVSGVGLEAPAVVPVLVGVLLIVVGNFLGKVRPNWFVGIRTPWTLSSKLSWVKTHRLGGWVLISLGVVEIALGISTSGFGLTLLAPLIAAGVAALYAYSYLVWRGDPDRSLTRQESESS